MIGAGSRCRLALGAGLLALVAGCASQPATQAPPRRPADVREQIVALLPPATADRTGWATDIYAAFAVLDIEPSASNLCAVLAVTEQESTFTADPEVAGLPAIARGEIERRAERLHVPGLLLRGALAITSPDGRSFSERLDAVRTEQELSRIYEDFVGMVPLGQRLLGGANPVRTGGPMQVRIDFSEGFARERAYPYPVATSIRHEVFTRRGGMFFGIAHLLGYPASYTDPLYRFADFNAGWYASRNAAFQSALSLASGLPLALDGDLILHDPGRGQPTAGATELAARSLAGELQMGDDEIRRQLELGNRPDFEGTALYRRVFELAERLEGRALPRALIPRIKLDSPKITRDLNTEWFATRVDQRHRRCMARASTLD